ncbi:MAG: ABC transporter permease, partial [Polyangiales bacterium]
MRLRDVGDIVRMALVALLRSPVRSGFLTVLGLAIGVSAFIAMTSFGEGAKRSVVGQFAGMGVHIVRIQSQVGTPMVGSKAARPLTAVDVETIARDVPTARRVVPSIQGRVMASTATVAYATRLYGTTPDYFGLHLWSTSAGGAFDEGDLVQRGKVCVIGTTPATMIFGSRNPLGETLSLDDRVTCNVIGVLESKGLSTGGRDLDDLIVIPLTTYEAYIGAPDGYSDIEVEARSAESLETVRIESGDVIRRTHLLKDSDPNDFRISSPTEAVKAAENISSIITRLLAAIAAVSLIVGGIGIMNIQLVSVAERTREIGTRAAIGASPDQIMLQFLAEALVLSSVGALIGIAVGVGAAIGVAQAMHWERAIDPLGVVGAAAFGLGA